MSDPAAAAGGAAAAYDVIYATDLVYQPDCWTLCGDAHCCHYDRYRRYGPPEQRGLTIIPMLAGEYAYMAERGLLGQYAHHDLDRQVLKGAHGAFVFEMLKIPVAARCPCDHSRRPTFCRLYPMMPLFDVEQGLVGLDPNFGFYEEFEAAAGTPRACAITETPPGQKELLARICDAIAASPRVLFSLMTYATMKRLFRERLLGTMRSRGVPAWAALPLMAAGNGEYVEREALVEALDEQLAAFRRAYGPGFSPGT